MPQTAAGTASHKRNEPPCHNEVPKSLRIDAIFFYLFEQSGIVNF